MEVYGVYQDLEAKAPPLGARNPGNQSTGVFSFSSSNRFRIMLVLSGSDATKLEALWSACSLYCSHCMA
jgi:hypothetical protein